MGSGPWAVTIRDAEHRLVFIIARFDDEFEARRLAKGWVQHHRDPRGEVGVENIPDQYDRRQG